VVSYRAQVKKGVPKLLQKRAGRCGIEITSNDMGQTTGIKRNAVNQGHRMLGFHLTGDVTSTAHEKIMKTKATSDSEAILNSNLQRGEISMVYNSYYMASLSYGTSATSFNIKECEEIQIPVVKAILPKWG
jgi:hypothetical protein